jgi:hypothetical protein
MGFESFGSEGLYSGRETHIRIAVCDDCSRRRRACLRRRWWRQHVFNNDIYQRTRVPFLCGTPHANAKASEFVVEETYLNGQLTREVGTVDGQKIMVSYEDGEIEAVEIMDDREQ